MHYSGITYRPPFETDSLLLQVTSGCSHNRCTFCTMYADVPFKVSPMEEIKADLEESKGIYGKVSRVFLENGDPFMLPTARLITIAEMINTTYPEVETIACYASIHNIMNKSVEDLQELRQLKINELNIGVESGLDEVLQQLNKGYTVTDAYEQLGKLHAAGMDYGLNIIIGAAGAEQYHEHALANARLLNETQPYLLFTGSLHYERGCELFNAVKDGRFVESTLGELLQEELTMLEALDLKSTYFFGLHPSNAVPLSGRLPQKQDTMIEKLRRALATLPAQLLSAVPKRGNEGRILQ